MIPLYINSLYNLLIRNNPILLYWHAFCDVLSMVLHYRQNMQHAQVKLHHLEHQLHTVEAYIDRKNPYDTSRFNVTR